MAGSAFSEGDDGLIAEINVTPLVDVVLVLLIILMVTATAIVAKTIPMDLPEAATGEQTSTTLAVSVDKAGKLYLDAVPISEAKLRTALQAARKKSKEVRAVIAADGSLAQAKVIHVIDLLRQEKVTKFAINVRPGEVGAK